MADFGKTLVNFGKEVLFDSLPEAVPVLKGRKDLEYPLNNPDDYKGRLMFSIFEEEPLDMAALVGLSGIFAKIQIHVKLQMMENKEKSLRVKV